jgi:hypothetical protein
MNDPKIDPAQIIPALPRPSGFSDWHQESNGDWLSVQQDLPGRCLVIRAIPTGMVGSPWMTLYFAGVVEPGRRFIIDKPAALPHQDPRLALAAAYTIGAAFYVGGEAVRMDHFFAMELIRLAALTLDGTPERVHPGWRLPDPPEPGLVPWASSSSGEAIELFWAPEIFPHPGDLNAEIDDPYAWWTEEIGRRPSSEAVKLEIAWPFMVENCEDIQHLAALGFRIHL